MSSSMGRGEDVILVASTNESFTKKTLADVRWENAVIGADGIREMVRRGELRGDQRVCDFSRYTYTSPENGEQSETQSCQLTAAKVDNQGDARIAISQGHFSSIRTEDCTVTSNRITVVSEEAEKHSKENRGLFTSLSWRLIVTT